MPDATITPTRASTTSPSCSASARPLTSTELALAARREAQPLVVFDRYEGMNRPAWGPVPPRGLWGAAMLRNLADGRVADPGEEGQGGLFKRPGQDYAG